MDMIDIINVGLGVVRDKFYRDLKLEVIRDMGIILKINCSVCDFRGC